MLTIRETKGRKKVNRRKKGTTQRGVGPACTKIVERLRETGTEEKIERKKKGQAGQKEKKIAQVPKRKVCERRGIQKGGM